MLMGIPECFGIPVNRETAQLDNTLAAFTDLLKVVLDIKLN